LGDSTEAYGWVKAMRVCADGAEVLLELTDIGRTAIEGKRWRYLSPVFPWEDFVYDDAARLRGHPRRVSRFAFTNRPRMRGIRPVVNAEGGPTQTPKPTPNPNPKGTSMDYKAKLLSMLGLADTATDEEIQAAIDAASGAKADAEADAALNAAGIPDTTAIRGPVKQAYRASAETGLNALNAVKATFALGAAAKPTPPARVPFRALNAEARTAPPALNGAAFESAREQAIEAASKIFNLKSRADAVARAQRERPDLWQ
jgi:phage I-like protein